VKNHFKMFVKMSTHLHKCWNTFELAQLKKGREIIVEMAPGGHLTEAKKSDRLDAKSDG
jgi:hypothetical protein